MKRIAFFLAVLVALFSSGGFVYAQHGHGAGGAMGGVGMHGDSDMHGKVGDSGTASSTGPKSESASAQLTENNHLNTALTKALGTLVPKGGLATACTGYPNLGRCISAIHVADNRHLDFFCLRMAMTGQPLPMGDNTKCNPPKTNLKLGQAIQALDPNADPKAEATKGIKQSDADIDNANHSQT